MIRQHSVYVYSKFLLLASFLIYILLTPIKINALPSISTNLSRQLVLIVALVLLIIFSLIKTRIIIFDKVLTSFLLIRIIFFGLISLLNLVDLSHYLSYMLIIAIFPIVYLCISNSTIDARSALIQLTKISVIIIGIQTASAFLTLVFQGHALYQIKNLIAIPFGNSNTIASIVVFQTVICYCLIKNKIYFIISTITLMFTMSRWGLFSYAVVIVILLVSKSNSKHKLRNMIIYITLIVLIYAGVTYLLPKYASTYDNAFKDFLHGNYDSLFNGRDYIYLNYKEMIIDKLLLGYGLGIETPAYGMAHNFIVQALYFGGVIGAVIYYFPYFLLSRSCFSKIKNNNNLVLFLCILALFINGFAENVFFTAPSEFISSVFIALIYKYQNTCVEEVANE